MKRPLGYARYATLRDFGEVFIDSLKAWLIFLVAGGLLNALILWVWNLFADKPETFEDWLQGTAMIGLWIGLITAWVGYKTLRGMGTKNFAKMDTEPSENDDF